MIEIHQIIHNHGIHAFYVSSVIKEPAKRETKSQNKYIE